MATLHERRGRGLRGVTSPAAAALLAGAGALPRAHQGPQAAARRAGQRAEGQGQTRRQERRGKGGPGGERGVPAGRAPTTRWRSRTSRSRSRRTPPSPWCCCTTTTRRRSATTTSARRRSASSTATAWSPPRATTSTATSSTGFPAQPIGSPDAPAARNGPRPGPHHGGAARRPRAPLRPRDAASSCSRASRPIPRASSAPTTSPRRRCRCATRTCSARSPGVRTWTDEQRAHYTQLPDDPRYKELADKIVEESLRARVPPRPVRAGDRHLRLAGQGEHLLHQVAATPTPSDPTADFLFGDRIGYCVHFAHAAAYLLRARGLPARIAAGYVADESRRGSGLGHPAAPEGRPRLGRALPRRLRLDHRRRGARARARSARHAARPRPAAHARRAGARRQAAPARARRASRSGRRWSRWLRAVADRAARALLALLGARTSVKMLAAAGAVAAPARAAPRVAYRAALDVLAERGSRREQGETRERFAARVPRRAPSLRALTRAARRARAYGARAAAPRPTTMRALPMRAARGRGARAVVAPAPRRRSTRSPGCATLDASESPRIRRPPAYALPLDLARSPHQVVRAACASACAPPSRAATT